MQTCPFDPLPLCTLTTCTCPGVTDNNQERQESREGGKDPLGEEPVTPEREDESQDARHHTAECDVDNRFFKFINIFLHFFIIYPLV